MAAQKDDFDVNPFYKALQEDLCFAFEQAQHHCHLICIPHTSTIQHAHPSSQFADMHILKPSPYFIGEYITTDRDSSCTVHMEDGIITTGNGFPEKRDVRILGEEMGYNKELKMFKILSIERPLVPIKSVTSGGPKFRKMDVKMAATDCLVSYADCVEYLHCFDEYEGAVQLVDEEVRQFSHNYLIVDGYIHDAVTRLKQLHAQSLQGFLKVLPASLNSDPKVKENIGLAIESYVVGRIHKKLYPALCSDLKDEDRNLRQRLCEVAEVDPIKLGLRQECMSSMKLPKEEFSKLDKFQTPLEKLNCLKNTMSCFSESISINLADEDSTSSNCIDTPCLTSDDLIPLLVCLLGECQPESLASNIYYMEHLHFASRVTDHLSYNFVTLKAAVEFINTVDLHQYKKVSPIVPYVHTRVATSLESTAPPPVPLDHQITALTHQLDLSGKEFAMATKANEPPCISPVVPLLRRKQQKSKNSNLGEFLSSLQNDTVSSSYGKQS